ESNEHETIGGFIVDRIGEIPEEGDAKEYVVEAEGFVFKVESVKDRRIDKILLTVPPRPEAGEDGEPEVNDA
ncbi:MAG: hemolysin, partial [Clostridiales Family XIII bacterium]|nr:hemolysin [Clostridiales Family XIII bacterium]